MPPCTSSASTSRGETASPPAWPSSTTAAAWCTSRRRTPTTRSAPPWRRTSSGDCLVAIDAPLVVRNATGNRPCEAALNRDFARFDAGAHPSNTRKPEFRDEPRGARLARALGLDIEPALAGAAPGDRGLPAPGHGRAVPARPDAEVQEQARPQPRPAPRRAALAGAPPRGARGRRRPAAPRPPGLAASWSRRSRRPAPRRTCAGRGPGRRRGLCLRRAVRRARAAADHDVRRPGDTATSSPRALPEGHRPSPRAAAGAHRPPRSSGPRAAPSRSTPSSTRRCGRPPTAASPRSPRCSTTPASTTSASPAGPRASRRSPTKAPREIDGTPVFADPLRDITDQIGVRVITYVHSDVDAVASCSPTRRVVLDDRDMGQETASEGRFGYSSRHLLARTMAAALPDRRASRCRCRSAPCSSTRGPSSSTTSATRARSPRSTCPTSTAGSPWPPGLLELADREFSQIRDRLQAGMTGPRPEPDRDDPRLSAQELAAFLAGQYADASWSRTDHYAWISGLLLELGITSLDRARRPAPAGRQRGAQRRGWATSTRRAPYAVSTTHCCTSSPSATSGCTATRTARSCSARLAKMAD